LAWDVRDYLENYLDESLFNEIKSVDLKEKVLIIKIDSPLLKNDFRMRKSFFLQKFKDEFGSEKFLDLMIL